jgi:hypothetical protein
MAMAWPKPEEAAVMNQTGVTAMVVDLRLLK